MPGCDLEQEPEPARGRDPARLRRYLEAYALNAAGIVFHTGPRTYHLGDRLIAVPISALWS